jgi:hypothetical protein
MPLGPLIVIIARLIIPLSIFRYPLWGGIISMLLDTVDVILIGILNLGDFPNYSSTDKYLDMYYLSFELIVSLRWTNTLARNTSIFLFAYRFIGFALFEITSLRILLLIFPNLFENFFIFFEAYKKIRKTEKLGRVGLIIALVLLLIPKMGQEYMLHYLEFGSWHWFRTEILHFRGID